MKVCLTNAGADRETPWAHDLGPASGPKGSRTVRLVNVPFLHAKPTWGDVIVVTPRRGVPTWDRAKTPWSKLGSLIVEDAGRWPMIVEYAPEVRDDDDACFDAMSSACAELEVVCESSFTPTRRPRGRAYLAVPKGTTDKIVMRHLAREVGAKLTQLFPKPAKRTS